MDFREQLARQLRYLERSSLAYDAGDREEGVRLAGPLAVIFHDTTESTSLLRHLGKKDIRLLSTARKYPKEWLWWPLPNLTSIQLCPQINLFRCVPNFGGGGGRPMLFPQWWNEIIYRRGREKMQRRSLVLDARNKDGVGHVDAAYTVGYQAMVDGSGLEIINKPDGEPEVTLKLRDVHGAALRQLAFEALNSPELTALAPDYRPMLGPADVLSIKETDSSILGLNPVLIKFGKPYA
jgi:hypothetical protein